MVSSFKYVIIKIMLNNKPGIVFILLASLLFKLCQPNFIFSVASTSPFVKDSGNITINLRTSTLISTLDISISNAFTISNPNCRVNGVAATCNQIIPSTGTNIIVRFIYNFAASTNYTLTFNLTNPPYAENFIVQAFNGATPFSNTASLAINAKTITCSMSSSSNVVSQQANATFLIGVSTMPAGTIGKISINVNYQTSFPYVINSSPVCMVDGSAVPCDLGQIFQQQALTISSVNVGIRAGASLSLFVNSIRNSPYNSTFETITITIRDISDNDVEKCSIPQPASTILQQSSIFAIQGWNSLVGATSNVQFLLTPFFTPLSDITICLVYQSQVTIIPKAPATQILTTSNGLNYLRITNMTYSSQILRFNATFQNPSSAISLSLISYILYNQTLFRQQKNLPSDILTLKAQTCQVSTTVNNPITLVSSILNITIVTPIKVLNGFSLSVAIQFGQFICSGLGLASSISNMTLTSCTPLTIIVRTTSDISSPSTFWISANYLTHNSIIPNTISVNMNSLQGNSIMSGSSVIQLGISSPIFVVTSSNSTYTALSNYSFIESNVTSLGSNMVRVVTFIPPTHVKITDTTAVIVSGSGGTVARFNIDLAGNTVIANVAGKISVLIINIRNPAHYLGGRDWTIVCKDVSGYSSSQSTSTQTPQYSPARSTISVTLSNQTIQQLSNITITYQPLLQYSLSSAPLLTTTFSASTINNFASNCPSCSSVTSLKFSMPYYAVVMRPTIQIINNKDPNGNSVSFSISIGDFVYQTGFISYVLNPLQFQFQSQFQGEFGSLGQLTIRITSVLSTPVSLNYTGIQNVFPSNSACQQCNSSYLFITGLVGYFESSNVIVEGYSNGILYARGVVIVKYTCHNITGCQICQTVNSTFSCLRCFSPLYTRSYLLYEGICYISCPVQTYENGAVCSACPNLCYRCTSVVCLECVTNYYIYLQSCVTDCPPLFIKNATHCLPRPVICPTNCVDCPQDNVCYKCDARYYLLQNLCYTNCPTSYIPNESQAICQLFVPPKETDYFPFAFFLASILALVLLRIIKFFEKRSLIVGNFIAFVGLMEIGAIILMISYTFISISTEPKRWINNNRLLMQALIFIIIVTKVALNLIFMAYFCRKIASDDNFEGWLNKSPYNNRLYIILLCLSSTFSFQIMRIIYCRLLGLQLFFGRFNTALIFKPLNFFSLAYIVPGGGLVVMAIFNIIMQDGYKTSIYYSSIEVILIQILILVSCIFQACRSDREYFDFQIYKVQNLSQNANSASKINLVQQQQVGGSINQMLINPDGSKLTKPVGYDPEQVGNETAGKIIRNKCWREVKNKKKDTAQMTPNQIIEIDNEEIKQEGENEQNNLKMETNSEGFLKLSTLIEGKQKSKQRSLFRKKILQDWEKLQKMLPQTTTHRFLRRSESRKLKSKSPMKKKSNQLKKVASLQKIEIIGKTKISIPAFKNKKQLKNYFYKIKNPGEKEELKVQQEKNIDDNAIEDMKNIDFINGTEVYENTDMERQDGQISQIPNNENEESFQKSLLDLRKDIKINRYEDFDNEIIQEDDEEKDEMSKNKNINSTEFETSKRKLKKRNVNKQTEAVYLQRLVSSSQNHRPKPIRREKLQDF